MWLQDGTLFGIRLGALGIAGAALAAAGICDAALRWIVRRKVSRDEAAAAETPEYRRRLTYWVDRGLVEALPPLSLLIWILALYTVLTEVLEQFSGATGVLTAAALVEWLRGAATVVALVWLMSRVGRLIESRLTPLSARSANTWDDVLLPIAGKAVRLLLPLVALILGVPALDVPPGFEPVIRNGLSLLLIGVVSFMLYQLVDAGEALLLQHYRIDQQDNLEARTVYTQVTVLKKVASAVIAIFTLASMLMVFESVRQFGTSILASAGIAGIIIGFAAQRSIATLLAGLQIAITQPIRIDDVVIVENEWGRIEDITLTYVVVRIWDERRLILPITYFIEQPFQNWTRSSSELLATVFLHLDYRVPLEPLREELTRVLTQSPSWDGRVNVLQVTDATERTVQVRALASASDASLAWSLRCEVREKLIGFLQRHHPDSLPRIRAELKQEQVA